MFNSVWLSVWFAYAKTYCYQKTFRCMCNNKSRDNIGQVSCSQLYRTGTYLRQVHMPDIKSAIIGVTRNKHNDGKISK